MGFTGGQNRNIFCLGWTGSDSSANGEFTSPFNSRQVWSTNEALGQYVVPRNMICINFGLHVGSNSNTVDGAQIVNRNGADSLQILVIDQATGYFFDEDPANFTSYNTPATTGDTPAGSNFLNCRYDQGDAVASIRSVSWVMK